MQPREEIWAFRAGRLDDHSAKSVWEDMQNPKTLIGSIVAKDRAVVGWLMNEPPWIATPKRITEWLFYHGLFWGLCIFAFWGSWQQWVFVLLAAHEVIHAIARRRLPKGTVYEGVVGLLYGAFLGVLVEESLNLATPIMPATIPPIFGAVGLWAGLGAGFGLRRRLQFGEIFWGEVGAQVVFAQVAIVPLLVALIAAGQFVGQNYAVGKVLANMGEFGLLIAACVAGVLPRKVEMGFRDAISVVLEGLSGSFIAVFCMWFTVWVFGMHLTPNSEWLVQWFTWETLQTLMVHIGGLWLWLDVCRGLASSRAAWEKKILPRYELVGDTIMHCGLVLFAADVALSLVVQGDYLDYSAERGLIWLNVLLATASVFVAWRFRSTLARGISISRVAWWLRSTPQVASELVGRPLFAFRLLSDTMRDAMTWFKTFALGVGRTALMMT